MFRYKTNKQAFVIAALVILLCLVCLTGATLALFTSDPNDGTIGIIATSGDLDIDIVDKAGVTLQNRALAFMITAEAANNSAIIFEPGATFSTQGFKIENKGDIPVNLNFSLSKDDNVDMEEFNQAFDVLIVKEGDDLANAEKLTDFRVKGLTAKTSSDTYCLLVKMKESADNGFQEKEYVGIGITVYAVQGNVNVGE